MTELSNPPISPDVDLRDFQFMPLDVVRLRDSDLALTATAEGFRAAVMLWCAAWHQRPPGSLPNNDKAIARLAGCDADALHQIRDEALHGFELFNDGRLYHLVVVEKAIEAWDGKERYRKAANKRWKNKKKLNNASHVKRIEDASCDASKTHDKMHMQGTGTGTGKETDKKNTKKDVMDDFDEWYAAYPVHKGRGQAEKAFKSARKKASLETLIAGALRYRKERANEDPKFNHHPATWLNGKFWLDEDQPTLIPRRPMTQGEIAG